MRQRARAFVIADPSNSTQRILFINAGAPLVTYRPVVTYEIA